MTSTRIAAAVVGLVVILPAVLWAGPWAVTIIVAFAMAVALDEYARMAFPDDIGAARAWLVLGTTALCVPSFVGDVDLAAGAASGVVAATMAFVAMRPGDTLDGAASRVGRYVLGMAWVGQLTFLVRLRALEHGVVLVILALAVSWLSDTGAYFAGRRFGRTKMAPRVSPKKTWEGFAGGVATAVIGVFVVRALWLPHLTAVDAVVVGLLGSAWGVVGDLAESLLKRSFDVKDSGWILPGHGGMLDRIDSVLFVAPAVWSYLSLIRGW